MPDARLEARLAHLERQVSRWRVATLGLASVMLLGTAVALAAPDAVLPAVRTQRLEVLDPAGNVRVYADARGLFVTDQHNRIIVAAFEGRDGGGRIELSHNNPDSRHGLGVVIEASEAVQGGRVGVVDFSGREAAALSVGDGSSAR